MLGRLHMMARDYELAIAQTQMAIERNPVSAWEAKALAEKQPDAAFTALRRGHCLTFSHERARPLVAEAAAEADAPDRKNPA